MRAVIVGLQKYRWTSMLISINIAHLCSRAGRPWYRSSMIQLHPTAEAAWSRLGDADPTLHALVQAVAGEPGWVVGDLVAALGLSADDAGDGRSRLGRAAVLAAAGREAELFGDDQVRCEYLLLGALGVLGDVDRLARARADFHLLMGNRAFAQYRNLVPRPRPANAVPPPLVLLAGLPGTGKSTLAESLASALPAPVFSMDWQLGALVPFGVLRPDNTGPLSELTLIAAAARQLQLGLGAIIDATGHTREFRTRLESLADSLGARFVGVECVCSDESEHRRRVEGRDRGIPGWAGTVTWAHVNRMKARWEDWHQPHLTLDTATISSETARRRILELIDDKGPARSRLVMISGPIAAGKSTLAGELVQMLRREGSSVALTDLDTVAEMALPTLPSWDQAHGIHAQLVGAWLRTGVDVVVDEGTSTADEVQQVLDQVPEGVEVVHVVLTADFDASLVRAQADPGRGISKDPAFLRAAHEEYARHLPNLPSHVRLHVEGQDPGALARQVLARLS
ncbi:AAA family ATPase [Promicromonospora sp. NPDC057488]|uniref:AAA family ATPase n=1 Tax=Promicromonospora sp. NPDC057488 TaxID=3346147 RepID=UPI00367210B2